MVDFSKIKPKLVSPASELLRATAEAVRPNNWLRGQMAETPDGTGVCFDHPQACRRCALAHLQATARTLGTSEEERWRAWNAIGMALWKHTRRTLPGGIVATLVEFNDEIATNSDDVAAIFDEAARCLETGASQ